MRLSRVGFAVTLLALSLPVLADQCPPAEKVISCHGNECAYQRLSGWTERVFYTDQGKEFSFQRARVQETEQGKRLSCFYTFIDPTTHKFMPPALELITIIN